MSNTIRIGVAAAVVVIAAVIGFSFVNNQTGSDQPTPTPTPTVEPTATALPRLNGQEPLPPGRYQVPNLPVDVSVEVPDGWSASANWVVIGPKGNAAPDGMAIRFYIADNLYVHPLAPNDGVLSPAVGPSADDFVNAMVAHPDWTVTGTTPITIDGYAGQIVHVTLPEGTSEATPFYLSVDAGGGQAWGWAPGQLFDIYVLDVAGQRLIVDAFHYPGTSEADLAAQQAVLASLELNANP